MEIPYIGAQKCIFLLLNYPFYVVYLGAGCQRNTIGLGETNK